MARCEYCGGVVVSYWEQKYCGSRCYVLDRQLGGELTYLMGYLIGGELTVRDLFGELEVELSMQKREFITKYLKGGMGSSRDMGGVRVAIEMGIALKKLNNEYFLRVGYDYRKVFRGSGGSFISGGKVWPHIVSNYDGDLIGELVGVAREYFKEGKRSEDHKAVRILQKRCHKMVDRNNVYVEYRDNKMRVLLDRMTKDSSWMSPTVCHALGRVLWVRNIKIDWRCLMPEYPVKFYGMNIRSKISKIR